MSREPRAAADPRAGLLARAVTLAARPLACAPPRQEPLPRAFAIIVLGAGLDARAELTVASRERVEAAAELWRRRVAPRVVVTGGPTRGAPRSEAEAMAEGLCAAGVPAREIELEPRSLTTRDNAERCAELLLGGGGTPLPVWLVTQPFHGRRARWWFRRVGFAPLIWHIADSVQYRDPARALQWTLREYLAWVKTLSSR